MQKVLCVLAPAAIATSDSVPTMEGTDWKRKGNNNDDVMQFYENISGSLDSLGYASLVGELSSAPSKDMHNAKLGLIKAKDDEEKEV